MRINRQDTNGTKPLLAAGELGYDNYPSGGDIGRVYVGTGSSNIAQAKKSEVVTVDGKVDTHVGRVDNPHEVTKLQIGLGNAEDTADLAKVVASAGKWTTARLINGSSVDGTSDVTTSKWGASRSITIGSTAKSVDGSSNITWTLGEIGAIGKDSPAFTGTPTATTAVVGTNTTQLATTAFVNAEIANDAIPRITSTDTAIPKFNGTTGNVQSSGIRIDSNDGIVIPKIGGGSTTVTVANGATNTNLVLPESGTVSGVTTAVTDNAIARYDGTTGKLQDSLIKITDDNRLIRYREEATDALTINSGAFAGVKPQIQIYTDSTGNAGQLLHIGNIATDSSSIFTRRAGTRFSLSYENSAGESSKSASIYVESTSAFSNSPSLKFEVGNTEKASIDSNGNLLLTSGTGGLGYGTGSGGTVTQLTSRTTGVTLSKLIGNITLFSTTTTAGQLTTFTVTNTNIAATDIILLRHISGGNLGQYIFNTNASTGSFTVSCYTPLAQTVAAAPVIKFIVIKGVVV